MRLIHFFISLLVLFSTHLFAQKDTAKTPFVTTPLFNNSGNVQLKGDTANKLITDTTKSLSKPKHDPKKATFRSAVLPGWGQIYNREYWKLPIVYGALAIPATLYVYNNKYYNRMKFAYQAVYAANYSTPKDPSLLPFVSSKVKPTDTTFYTLSTYQKYRNSYKRNKDYSLLWFILVWGLNVADATVFGHLKDFDVSDDLTMHINPAFTPSTKALGLSVVFNLKNLSHKRFSSFK